MILKLFYVLKIMLLNFTIGAIIFVFSFALMYGNIL